MIWLDGIPIVIDIDVLRDGLVVRESGNKGGMFSRTGEYGADTLRGGHNWQTSGTSIVAEGFLGFIVAG